jgi:hypothetical protein
MDTDAITIIHARFGNDGVVTEIGERPANLSPPQWFQRLCEAFPLDYRAMAGGRGVFRVSKSKVEALRAEASTAQAA